MIDPNLVTRLLADEAVSERVKLDDYLLLAAGVRRLGMLTYPAEFPDAAAIGQEIDARFASRYYRGTDPELGSGANLLNRLRHLFLRAMRSPVAYKTMLLQEVVTAVLRQSATYRAHRQWASALGLRTLEAEVRPSIRELFLYRDAAVGSRLSSLMELRERIREEARAVFRPGMPALFFVYPEERSEEYVQAMGELLGYPDCCVQAYVRSRRKGEGELPQATAEAGEPLAYFVRDFVPCRPSCPAAAAVGRLACEKLAQLDPRLPDRYLSLVRSHRDQAAGTAPRTPQGEG
jgi:hypothetical protein